MTVPSDYREESTVEKFANAIAFVVAVGLIICTAIIVGGIIEMTYPQILDLFR